MGEIDVVGVLRERNDAQDQCARLRVALFHLSNEMTVSQLAAMRADVLRTVLAVRFCDDLGDVADVLLSRPWPPEGGVGMEDRVTPESFTTLERVCDPVSVTVTDLSSSGDYHASRSVTVALGACGTDELVSVIRAAASEAAQGRVGR